MATHRPSNASRSCSYTTSSPSSAVASSNCTAGRDAREEQGTVGPGPACHGGIGPPSWLLRHHAGYVPLAPQRSACGEIGECFGRKLLELGERNVAEVLREAPPMAEGVE